MGRDEGRVGTERREWEEGRVEWGQKGESGKREGESEDRKKRVGRENGTVRTENREWEERISEWEKKGRVGTESGKRKGESGDIKERVGTEKGRVGTESGKREGESGDIRERVGREKGRVRKKRELEEIKGKWKDRTEGESGSRKEIMFPILLTKISYAQSTLFPFPTKLTTRFQPYPRVFPTCKRGGERTR